MQEWTLKHARTPLPFNKSQERNAHSNQIQNQASRHNVARHNAIEVDFGGSLSASVRAARLRRPKAKWRNQGKGVRALFCANASQSLSRLMWALTSTSVFFFACANTTDEVTVPLGPCAGRRGIAVRACG